MPLSPTVQPDREPSIQRALRLPHAAWLLCLALAAGPTGCDGCDGCSDGKAGSDGSGAGGGPTDPDAKDDPETNPELTAGFDVSPEGDEFTLDVDAANPNPTLVFNVSRDGVPLAAAFAVDRSEVARITVDAAGVATLSATGKVGGWVTVSIRFGETLVKRKVLIRLSATQKGPTDDELSPLDGRTQIAKDPEELLQNGGVGGVGGEGLGSAPTDQAFEALKGTPTAVPSPDQLKFLYPYDGTVWPRGLPAPLLMWEGTNANAKAIRIDLKSASGSYNYTGYFGPPGVLGNNATFTRHPIPQKVWDAATESAGGLSDKLTVSLTVYGDGGAHGPISQTWTIAKAKLSGTIYYNSYGTNLVKNYPGALLAEPPVGDEPRTEGPFGAAVLSIRAGDYEPKVAGGVSDGGAGEGCRTCHSVSANGSRMVASKHIGGDQPFAFDLSNAEDKSGTEISIPLSDTLGNRPLRFPAISRDGTLALAEERFVVKLPDGKAVSATTGLESYKFTLKPAFSPSDKLVAFTPGGDDHDTCTNKLVIMDFNYNSETDTATFSNPLELLNHVRPDGTLIGSNGETCPGWPAFMADSKSLVYQQGYGYIDNSNHQGLKTWGGAKAKVQWLNFTGESNPMNALNGLNSDGTSYLPRWTKDNITTHSCAWADRDPTHDHDSQYNFEPTISPTPAGGYAWVVFVSRRMYGNLATIPPACSDPRYVNLTDKITTKKLWVAAIDLDPTDGTDPSHPAFYLPGQELLGANSRGFWALDPCSQNGVSCETGDQCCGGHCNPDATGALQCSDEADLQWCKADGESCELGGQCCSKYCVDEVCSANPNLG